MLSIIIMLEFIHLKIIIFDEIHDCYSTDNKALILLFAMNVRLASMLARMICSFSILFLFIKENFNIVFYNYYPHKISMLIYIFENQKLK